MRRICGETGTPSSWSQVSSTVFALFPLNTITCCRKIQSSTDSCTLNLPLDKKWDLVVVCESAQQRNKVHTHLVLESKGVKTNKSSLAYFWVISLLFWEVVKTGSITRELRESNRVMINHSRGVVFSKRRGRGGEISSRMCLFQAPEGRKQRCHKKQILRKAANWAQMMVRWK